MLKSLGGEQIHYNSLECGVSSFIKAMEKIHCNVFIGKLDVSLFFMGFECIGESFLVGNNTFIGTLADLLVSSSCS